jgi:hypothetical protein
MPPDVPGMRPKHCPKRRVVLAQAHPLPVYAVLVPSKKKAGFIPADRATGHLHIYIIRPVSIGFHQSFMNINYVDVTLY